MTNQLEVMTAVRELVRGALKNPELQDDDDLFDAGATSLTVVDLQLRLEERLNRCAPTHLLMASPSMHAWATIYAQAQTGTNPDTIAFRAASEAYSHAERE